MYKRHTELPVNREGQITATYISLHYKEGSGGGRRVRGWGYGELDKQTDRQTDRQTETGRQTDREEEEGGGGGGGGREFEDFIYIYIDR